MSRPELWEVDVDPRPLNLGVAGDSDPAVRRAREILRKLHDELATLDLRGHSPFERRAYRLLLGHLEAGYDQEERGRA